MRSLAAELMDALEAAPLVQLNVKPWGFEQQVQVGDALVKIISVDRGHRTSLQHHERKEEVILVLEGDGGVQNDAGVLLAAKSSKAIRIRPGTVHRSVGLCVILEVSTNDPDDVVRHADDYGREDEA